MGQDTNAYSGLVALNRGDQPGPIVEPPTKPTIAAQSIAQASNAQVLLDTFAKNGYQAVNCGNGNQVNVVPIETRFLQQTENRNPQYDISNADATDQKVILGSVLGIGGAYAFYGQNPSACDDALVSDQFGANIRAVQGFSNLVNHNPVIATIVQMISTDATQLNQPFTYNDITYDATVNKVTSNTTSTFTRFDTATNVVNFGGVWPLGPQTFLAVNSKATKAMTITLTMSATASIRSFRAIQ